MFSKGKLLKDMHRDIVNALNESYTELVEKLKEVIDDIVKEKTRYEEDMGSLEGFPKFVIPNQFLQIAELNKEIQDDKKRRLEEKKKNFHYLQMKNM